MNPADHFRAVLVREVRGQNVTWANNGRVYFSRDLHDRLPDDMQGRSFQCNTPREFDALCRQFAVLAKEVNP